jgi:tetratricopeptide (TPR) repeat protein
MVVSKETRMRPLLALTASAILVCSAITIAQDAPLTSAEIVRQARRDALLIREGRFELAAPSVAKLEAATAANPNNAALWNALSSAYFMQATALSQPPDGNVLKALSVIERAGRAVENALRIDPNNAEALAARGGGLTIAALFQQKPDLVAEGIRDMNRAVELAPMLPTPRLVRAFFGINVAPALRPTAAVVDDLQYLIRISEGRRPSDVLHLLLGDLYAETGKVADARREYEASAARPASTQRDRANARLVALNAGTPVAGEATQLRGRLGTDCMMCHAR